MAGRIPQLHFDVLTYTGNGAEQKLSGLKFSPDLVWIKNRSDVQNHVLVDTVRGRDKSLYSDQTYVENTSGPGVDLISFDSNGFTLGPNSQSGVNTASANMVAWCWNAGEETKVLAPGALNDEVYNRDEAWSTYGTGTPNNGGSDWVRAFNGKTSPESYEVTFSAVGSMVWEPPTPLPVNDYVTFYVYNQTNGSDHGLKVNGNYVATTSNSDYALPITLSASELGGQLSIVELVTNGSSVGAQLTAVEVDGKVLADPIDDTRNWTDLITTTALSTSNNSYSTTSKLGAFDGLSNTSLYGGGGVPLTITFDSSVFPAENGPYVLEVKTNQRGISVNGGAYTTDIAPNQSSYWAKDTVTHIDTITIDDVGGAYGGMTYGIRVNGKMLVMPTYNNLMVPSIETTLRANPDGGFSVAKWTGEGVVAHGLNKTPDLIIAKITNNSSIWPVQVKSLGSDILDLSSSDTAAADSANRFGGESTPYSFSAGSWWSGNNEGIAYSFSSVPGVSSIGSYTGNGVVDGPMVNCGFKPRWILFKRTDSVSSWRIHDTARGPHNPLDTLLFPDLADADTTNSVYHVDILSNGFKVRNTNDNFNASGGTYMYMAFADKSQAKPVMETIQFEPDVYSTWDRKQYDFAPGDTVTQTGTSVKLTGDITSVTDNDNGTQTIVTTNDVGSFDIGDTLTQEVDITTSISTSVSGSTVTLTDDTNLAGFDTGVSVNMTFDAAGTVLEATPETSTILDKENVLNGSFLTMNRAATNLADLLANGTPMDDTTSYPIGTFMFYVYGGAPDTGNPFSANSAGGAGWFSGDQNVAGAGCYDADGNVISILSASYASTEFTTFTYENSAPTNTASDYYKIFSHSSVAYMAFQSYGAAGTAPTVAEGSSIQLTLTDNTDLNLFREGDKIVDGPSKGYKTVLYSGNSSTQELTGLGFSPDMVWIKSLTNSIYAAIADTIRGPYYFLSPSLQDAQRGPGFNDDIVSFDEDGFTLGADTYYAAVNQTGQNYVAWCFDRDESFDMHQDTYTISGTLTWDHNLDGSPDFVIVKPSNITQNWAVYHKEAGADRRLTLNSPTNGVVYGSDVWFPASGTFGVSANILAAGGTQNVDLMSYMWTETTGRSKFGTYTGTGSALDIDCGFKAAFTLIKRIDADGDWHMTPYSGGYMFANLANGISDASVNRVVYTDSGFQITGTDADINGSGATYIYAAFAAQEEIATVLQDGDTINNQLVVDGGTWDTSNKSEVWSDNLTMGTTTYDPAATGTDWNPANPPALAFDGDDDTITYEYGSSRWIYFRPTTPISVTSTVEFGTRNTVEVKINGVDQSYTGGTSGWETTLRTINFTGSLTEFAIRDLDNTGSTGLSAITIDGNKLVDAALEDQVWSNHLTCDGTLNDASLAFDGDLTTFAYATNTGEELTLDLPTPLTVNTNLYIRGRQTYPGGVSSEWTVQYKIYTSDLSTPAYTVSNTNGQDLQGDPSLWGNEPINRIRIRATNVNAVLVGIEVDGVLMINKGARGLGYTTATGNTLSATGTVSSQSGNDLTLSTSDKFYPGTYLNSTRTETATITGLDEDTNSITIAPN